MAATALQLLHDAHQLSMVFQFLLIDAYSTQRTLRSVDSTLLMCAAELYLLRGSLEHIFCRNNIIKQISDCRLPSPLFQLVSLHGPPGVVPGV
jgi:hypothetical protein